MTKHCVVIQYTSFNIVVHGPFNTEGEAQDRANAIVNGWNEIEKSGDIPQGSAEETPVDVFPLTA